MLITIEGIDGSGKATQTKLLAEHLRKEKYNVQTLDFPGYERNFFGKVVRRYLQGEFGAATKVNPYLASLTFALDRWESRDQIRQWLNTGNVVVLDRYVHSNIIHQTVNLPPSQRDDFERWELTMEFDVLGLPKPDLTVFLHIPIQIAYQLMQQRGRTLDGLEQELAHLETAERQCLKLAKELRWQTIECIEQGKLLAPEAIHQKVWNVVQKKFQLPPNLN